MRKQLSLSQKMRHIALIIQRDGGTRCLFCKRRLTPRTAILEHLNGDESDTRIDNLVLSCQSCNVKKGIGYDKRILGMAEYKLIANERSAFVGEKFLTSVKEVESKENEQTHSEIDINRRTWEITQNYLNDEINGNGSISYSDVLHSLVFLCQEQTGHGSENTIRRHIAAFTSRVGPFEERGGGRRRVIVKRDRRLFQ